MPNLPSASVTIDQSAVPFAGAAQYLVILACVGRNADGVPRVYSSSKAILDQYDYSPGADYAAIHMDETRKPVIFVGMPIVTAGVLGRVNSSGVTGTCAISVAAGSTGFLEETVSSLTVVTGGTIGTNGITFNLSCDGGWTTKLIRLGTNSSYTIPYLGIVLNFGAGTLNAGDTYSFTTTAPLWDTTGMTAARNALASQQNQSRSWLVVGDLPNSTFAGYVTSQVDAYETANQRFTYARASVRDQLPLASMSQVKKTMTGAPNLTFDGTAHTATRASGSFITDGFAVNDSVTFAGSTSNNVTKQITALTATVMTFAAGLVNEGPVGGVSCVGSASLTFAAAGNTLTRTAGSWLSDGFAVGDSVTITGTVSNNFTAAITVLTATVMTFASGVVNEGPSRSDLITVTKGETRTSYVSTMTTAFASVDGEKRIDISLGRARRLSPITGWSFRRPASWACSAREYTKDLQIPCWRKSDGPLLNWDMTDGAGKVVEYDERVDGGGLAGRFTTLRTYGNGPNGSFVSLSLTRDTEGSILSRTQNMAVANLAETVVQKETENAIGQVLVLNDDGTGTLVSLQKIEERVNSALQVNLLQKQTGDEAPRASKAVWVASKTDNLSVVGATMNGVLNLKVNGAIEQIATRVRVN